MLKGQDHLHLKVYDEDVVGKDSIGSAKISLKKIQQAGGHLDEWVKLPAHLGLSVHGEIHVIMHFTVSFSFFHEFKKSRIDQFYQFLAIINLN